MYTVLLYWCHTQTEYSLYVYTAAGLDIERRRVRLNSSDRNAEALLHFNQKYPEEEDARCEKGKTEIQQYRRKTRLLVRIYYWNGKAAGMGRKEHRKRRRIRESKSATISSIQVCFKKR